MKLLYFHVDAFCSQLFGGNSASVCLLDEWLPDVRLQAIATETRTSVTVFLLRLEQAYAIRSFTSKAEVDFCGHGNIAAAHVLWNHLAAKEDPIVFETRAGNITHRRRENFVEYELPLHMPEKSEAPAELLAGLQGTIPTEVRKDRDYLVLLESETALRALKPDTSQFLQLASFGVIVTAPGDKADFVSRYFAPRFGISEDSVTDIIHCELAPFWAERLGKKKFRALQASARGAELYCEVLDKNIRIAGQAVTFLEGVIHFPGLAG